VVEEPPGAATAMLGTSQIAIAVRRQASSNSILDCGRSGVPSLGGWILLPDFAYPESTPQFNCTSSAGQLLLIAFWKTDCRKYQAQQLLTLTANFAHWLLIRVNWGLTSATSHFRKSSLMTALASARPATSAYEPLLGNSALSIIGLSIVLVLRSGAAAV
jgi:hypothetical protein